jgi:hypothetical protein
MISIRLSKIHVYYMWASRYDILIYPYPRGVTKIKLRIGYQLQELKDVKKKHEELEWSSTFWYKVLWDLSSTSKGSKVMLNDLFCSDC